MLNDQRDVSCVDCTLLRAMYVAASDVGLLDGVAGGVDVNANCGGVMLKLPLGAGTDDCIYQSLLWYTVENKTTRSPLTAISWTSSGVHRKW